MLYHNDRAMLPCLPCARDATSHGGAPCHVAFDRVGARTAVTHAYATSPLRLLLPNNHGHAAWVYLASLGGGLVGGDRVDLTISVGREAAAFVSTQASTKVYRSTRGCGQRIAIDAAEGSTVAVVPDPVVCFAGARYEQKTRVSLGRGASLFLLDGYTCGRAARGERWRFDSFASRTSIERDGRTAIVDATRLDPLHGPLWERMGRFDVVLTLIAAGPRFVPIVKSILSPRAGPAPGDRTVIAASAIGPDAAILRVAAERFESGSLALRTSFTQLTEVLGDDPFARKW
jgi:urease accessory protein